MVKIALLVMLGCSACKSNTRVLEARIEKLERAITARPECLSASEGESLSSRISSAESEASAAMNESRTAKRDIESVTSNVSDLEDTLRRVKSDVSMLQIYAR